MSGKWLTPDDDTISTVAYKVYLPDDDTLRACFYGAFLLLCEASNWEQFGTMTPEQASELFNDAWIETMPYAGNISECTS